MARQAPAITLADDDGAGLRPLKSGQHVDQRGLAGAVRPDQAEDFAALQGDADLIDGDEAAEPDADRLRRQAAWRSVRSSLAHPYCSGGNDSTVKRPTQANLPLVACRIAIGRVVWMCSFGV